MTWIVPAAALAALVALGIHVLWPTDVPDDLRLPELDPRDFFTAAQLERARDYERFLQINSLLSAVALVVVVALYARHGARFTRESAAGRIGTGMLLGMLGLALVWIVQLPFGIAELWWERRHGISKVGYLDAVLGSFLSLGGVFLFACLAILIAMAFAAPLRTLWWAAAAPAFVAVGLLIAFVGPFLIPDLDEPPRGVEADARRFERVQDLDRIPVKVQRVRKETTAPNAEAAGIGPTGE